MSVYSRTPGHRPGPVGPRTTVRISPVGAGTRTSSSRSFTVDHPTRSGSPGPRPWRPGRSVTTLVGESATRVVQPVPRDHARTGVTVDNPIERPLRALDSWQQRHRLPAVAV